MMPCQYSGPAAKGPIPAHLAPFATAKKYNRRVTFKPTVTVQPIDCRMSEVEKSRSYYSKEELNSFPLKVKAAQTRELTETSSAFGAHHEITTQDGIVRMEADPPLRGLELKLCPIRVRNKLFVEKALLKVQNSLNANPKKTREEKLLSMAAASTGLSCWSRLVALETARLDALRAYEGDYLIPTDDEPIHIMRFPCPTATKRRCVSVSLGGESKHPKRKRSCLTKRYTL